MNISNLSEVLKVLLILSHGQLQSKYNFLSKKASYISQRIIHDKIKFACSLFNIPISKEMKASVSSANSKYMLYLEEENMKETENSKKKKKKLKTT